MSCLSIHAVQHSSCGKEDQEKVPREIVEHWLSGTPGTACRENPCGIEGFGYKPLRQSCPAMLDIPLALDESLDEGEDAWPLCPPVFPRKVASGSARRARHLFCLPAPHFAITIR